MRLSNKDVEFYARTGWYLSDHVVEEALIDRCVASAERIYRCQYDRTQPWSASRHINTFNRPYTDRTQMRVDQFPSFHDDAIREVVRSPEIAEIAAQLLRTDEVRSYKDILIGTPAKDGDSAIGWHTDASYWPTCAAERMITIYVPLQERDRHNGTLLMVNGSHQWVNRSFNISARFEEFEKLRSRYQAQGHPVELCPMPHRKGQVSFHSSLVVHATYPNVTDEFQHSVVFGLQARDNRYIPSPLKRLDPTLVVSLNDEIGPKLPDGTPDLKDDDFYPVLYRAPGAPRS